MWEFVKKSLSFSLGVAALTADKLRQFVDEAVERGDMSREEAKKFVDEVTARAEDERRNVQTWIREQVRKTMSEAGLAEASRVDALERRISELEKRMAGAEEAPALGEPMVGQGE